MLNNLSTTQSFCKFHPHLLHSSNKSPSQLFTCCHSSSCCSPSTPPLQQAALPHLNASPTKLTHPVCPVRLLLSQQSHTVNYLFASCSQPSFRLQEPVYELHPPPLLLIPQISLSSKALMSHSIFKGVCSITPHRD